MSALYNVDHQYSIKGSEEMLAQFTEQKITIYQSVFHRSVYLFYHATL
jgi:hypothetical protein